MKRIVEPEWLDELPADDPDAVRSRRDLCRVNAWMRHHAIMAGALQSHWNGQPPRQITELGAGDGNFLLGVAKRLSSLEVPSCTSRDGPDRLKPVQPTLNVSVMLLDRQKIVTPQTITTFTSLGWRAEAVTANVFDWLPAGNPAEVVIANLLLHHFENERLADLFRKIAGRARLFIALEPRRAAWPLFCSRLLGAIGCNRVTRHDAVLSVRAGFNGDEFSRLWPRGDGWQLTEQRAGLFSHLFIAQKNRQAT